MSTLSQKLVAGGLILGCLVATPRLGHATEPGNNTVPWNASVGFRGDASFYNSIAPGSSLQTWSGLESISPTGDVDYHLAACSGRTVRALQIGFTHSAGDLDIAVYDLAGVLLGTSTGVTNSETVSVLASSAQGVILKVYGYNGAVNPYSLTVFC